MKRTAALLASLLAASGPNSAVIALATPATRATTQPAWVPVPIRSAEQAARRVEPGGEGGQWPRGPVAVSATDPNFLLLPIDVGGVYRSLDGGKRWRPAMVGWLARGANAFVIDPRNADHVLGVAANSTDWNPACGASPNGLYRSLDRAASWTQVCPRTEAIAGAVAWDPSSHDDASKGCRRAFYLNCRGELFRSDDGGATWTSVNAHVAKTPEADWTLGGVAPTMLCVDARGRVWAAGAEGVFRSDDAGVQFNRLRDRETLGLAVVGTTIVVSGADGVLASHDDGKTFVPLAMNGLDRGPRGDAPVHGVAVSPADPRRMLCWVARGAFDWPRFASRDGGATWQPATLDTAGATLATNARQGHFAWAANDPNVAFSLGGDWVSRSADAGRSFGWSNNGNNGVMVGGLFNFNAAKPDVMFLGFQDYNGAITLDGGRTWTVRDVSGKGWGGHVYGAVAMNERVMWGGEADGWEAPRRLRITRDGGATWAYVNGDDGKPLDIGRTDVSFIDPMDGTIGFAGRCRTADGGNTWAAMAGRNGLDGCDGVFAADPASGELFGRAGGDTLVHSLDRGVSWRAIARIEGGFRDLALDPGRHRVYLASQDRLKVFELPLGTTPSSLRTIDTPRDSRGATHIWTVATDPGDPSIVYVGGPANVLATDATVCRSTDAGQTWTNLTVTTPLAADQDSGPREVSAIRVNPSTHEAWAAGECFGLWKLTAP